MASTDVTLDDILDAIAAARASDDGEGKTTNEIAAEKGISLGKTRTLIKAGLASGQLRATKKWVVSPLSGARAPQPSFVVVKP